MSDLAKTAAKALVAIVVYCGCLGLLVGAVFGPEIGFWGSMRAGLVIGLATLVTLAATPAR